MTLISRLAETLGTDPTLTQSIRIDVNVHNAPTVTVTRLADADQIGRIIQCSTFADYTLVKNDELKRLRSGVVLTAEERSAVEEVIAYLQPANQKHENHVATILRGMLERTK